MKKNAREPAVSKRMKNAVALPATRRSARVATATRAVVAAKSGPEQAVEDAAVGRLVHDESEADDDGFIAGAGFDRYGGFPGDGLS